ncbi:ABC transporter permease [Candidatus Parcubacteria bacterium]|jgi:putative ABC transport system permease protein|nr:ABC transporter permease [Candidatus Komeilibacteria bacterium]MBT4447316.1 ABC transporter permease [Candidatus Komeilibacteria bacterium]MBT4849335.1 ABC transporter permease [Candidatus Parcubacteria bacterium]
MNIKASFFLARTTILRGNKGTLIMTILIMTLAYVNLIFISSVFGGIVEAINEQSIKNLYSNIVIAPADDEVYIENKYAMDSIDTIPGIVASSAHYINNTLISYDANNDGNDVQRGKWIVKSVDVEDEIRVTQISDSMIEGEYLDSNDRDKIVIGKEIAGGHGGDLDYLSLGGVYVGDEIDIKFSNGIRRTYTIKGIFSTKNSQADQMAFVTTKEMESVLGVYNLASEVIVKINDDELGQEEKYIKQIRQTGLVDEDIKTWKQLTGFTSSASKSFTMISIILGAIGTVVAGVTIFIIIFVSIVNKRKQIGILKAIGMKESTIILSFVMQAIFYAVIGIIFGVSIILFLIRPFFINNPLDFPVGWVSLKITFNIIRISNISLVIAALIGGFIPAFRGTKESILDTIWG